MDKREDIDKKITKDIDKTIKTLKKGGLVVYPTETVYGLGCDAFNNDSVDKVFRVKRRKKSNPISIAIPNIEQIEKYTKINQKTKNFLEKFLPGPVTPLLHCTYKFPDGITYENKIGIRIPDNKTALNLLSRYSPITSTSANFSGQEEARKIDELNKNFIQKIDLVLDGGKTTYGTGSTVVDTDSWKIIREGALIKKVKKWIQNN